MNPDEERLKAYLDGRDEPLPCPFCGSEDVAGISTAKERCYIICRECRGRTRETESILKAEKLWIGTRLR